MLSEQVDMFYLSTQRPKQILHLSSASHSNGDSAMWPGYSLLRRQTTQCSREYAAYLCQQRTKKLATANRSRVSIRVLARANVVVTVSWVCPQWLNCLLTLMTHTIFTYTVKQKSRPANIFTRTSSTGLPAESQKTHNNALIDKTADLNERNFLIRVLYMPLTFKASWYVCMFRSFI